MKRYLAICLSLFIFAACQNAPQNINTTNQNINSATNTAQPKPADAVHLSAEKAEIKAGSAGEAIIKLKIEPPFHVNSNPPSDNNLIATQIEFEPAEGLILSNPVYQPGEQKKFSFSDKPLSVYQGETTIRVPIKTAANITKGAKTLKGKLKFQPCDDKVCYRPQTQDVSVDITVN